MSKVAQTENPVHDIIRGRWSPRAFSDQTISDADLATLLEAAGWAASAFNAQPWRYVYAHRGTAEFDAILSSLVEFNQGWAKHAAVIAVICAEAVNGEGKENRHAWYDTGAASATLIL